MSKTAEYTRIGLAAAHALSGLEGPSTAVYLPGPTGDGAVLYREAGTDLTQHKLDRLRQSGVSFLYVRYDDFQRYATLLEGKLSELLDNPELQSNEKAELVQQIGTSVAGDLTHGTISPDDLARTSILVNTVIKCVLKEPAVAAHLLHMAAHERSTASHMFVVSSLAVLLGREIFGSDHEMLRGLGLAGMTHDLGKLAIGSEILNKRSPLTVEELRLIHQHPVESVRLLGDDPKITPAVRQMILQHHERVDGGGYPLGVPKDELLPGSRILSIVDSFHAMIGYRPYRSPMTPADANRTMATQAGRQFDADFLRCWCSLFERHEAPPEIGQFVASESDGVGEGTARQEHRPTPQRQQFGSRPRRFTCDSRITVKCLYAGRLSDATCAPDEFDAALFDVSRGGLCLLSTYPMYRGEGVHIQIEQNAQPIWVRGVVAWCRPHDANEFKIGVRLSKRLDSDEVDTRVAVAGITPSKPGEPVDDEAGEGAPSVHGPSGGESPASAPQEMTREDVLAEIEAIAGMRRIDGEAEKKLVGLTSGPDPVVRCACLDALGNAGTTVTRRTIVRLLRDEDPEVRSRAATVVGAHRIGEALRELLRLLDDQVQTVALCAAGALGNLGEQVGLKSVAETLEGSGPHTRLAARVFGEIVGHRFPANAHGVKAARGYLAAKRTSLIPSR